MGGRSGQSVKGGGISYGVNRTENINATIAWGQRNGIKIIPFDIKTGDIALASVSNNTVYLNKNSKYWNDPKEAQKAAYKNGFLSTTNPLHVVLHESAHLKYKNTNANWINKEYQSGIAGQVSRYAMKNPIEFVAETYAGLRTGKKYSKEVMQLYKLFAT